MRRRYYFCLISSILSTFCSCQKHDQEDDAPQELVLSNRESTKSDLPESSCPVRDEEELKRFLDENRSSGKYKSELRKQLLFSYGVVRESADEAESEFKSNFQEALEKPGGRAFIDDNPELFMEVVNEMQFESTSIGTIAVHFFQFAPSELTGFLKEAGDREASRIDAFVYFALKDDSYKNGVFQDDDPRIGDFKDWFFLAKCKNPVYRLLGAEIMCRLIRDKNELTEYYLQYKNEELPAILKAVAGGLEAAGTTKANERLEDISRGEKKNDSSPGK